MELSEIKELMRIQKEIGSLRLGIPEGYVFNELGVISSKIDDIIEREFTGGKVVRDKKGVVVNPLEG